MKSVKDYESGTKHMEITSKTYWYVKKFLAHKVAFENVVRGTGEIKVLTVVNRTQKSMSELAKEFAVDEQELKNYNKWVRKDYVPGDRPYTIAIPTTGDNRALTTAIAKATKSQEQPTRVEAKPAIAKNDVLLINGITAMKVHSGENATTFVKRAGVDLSYFLKCNDLSISDKLISGDYYYLKKKKAKASVPQHVVKPGDNLWSISQQYGVQLRKLQKYNNTTNNIVPEGSVIYLSSKKVTSKNPQKDMEVAEVDTEATFNWAIEPETLETSISPVPMAPVGIEIKADSTVETIKLKSSQHTVVAGETLYSIAKQYQVGVMEIVQWNNLKLEEGIKPGQVLSLQVAEENVLTNLPSTQEIVHQVKPSDTLYSVARQYGVTIKELMDWNQKTDFTLTVGENLKILKK
jgi:membrane-bound lytic murein transglycosylase D